MSSGFSPGFAAADKGPVYTPNIDHLAFLLEVIADLVLIAKSPTAAHNKSKESPYLLTSFDRDVVLTRGFFATVISDDVGVDHVEKIILHWIGDSRDFSKFIIFLLRDGILNDSKNVGPYMRLVCAVQDYVDELQYWRVDVSLLEFLRTMRRMKQEERHSMEQFLRFRMRSNELVRRWLDRHIDLVPSYYFSSE
jgi:hypothetical protein